MEIRKAKIKKISIIQNEDVYDITVEKNHNFYANNILVHNCAELPLPHGGSCCLGSINLSNMFDEEKNDINWSKLAKTVVTGVRFLDNVLTINRYPIPASEEAAHNGRQIGLGTLGLHYLLIKLGLKYGSKKSLEFIERLFATIRNEAYEASIELAKERGAFPKFERDTYLNNNFVKKLPPRLHRKIKKYGIRNVSLLTCAPTGTISMISGVSSGIEPIFAPVYKRKYRIDGALKEELVMDSLFAEYISKKKDLKGFNGAYDVTPEEHLSVQSTIQEFVDASLSKTINLPKGYTSENLADTLLDFVEHLKGVTIYQAGSRGDEPLTVVD
jgi:ribonucleoside-diphosphate reductase alpha chain